MKLKVTACVGAVAAIALMVFGQAASARISHRSDAGIPATTLRFCAATHVSCAGHWRKVGGQEMYQLATRFTLNGPRATITSAGTNYFLGSARNYATNTCWTSLGAGYNGAPAELWACNGSANQTWWMDTGKTSYGGFVFFNAGDSKCLNNTNGSGANGNRQQMWDCYNSQNETYYVNARDYGYSVQPYAGGCLTSLGNASNGAPLELYGCNFGANQTWEGNF